jgi:hypothetical protein
VGEVRRLLLEEEKVKDTGRVTAGG